MEWTRDKTLALINEYRKRRGLWDMTHDDYRKKEMKQKLLVEVAASLGDSIPVVEIEKKFHTLRTQYHREINRMKRKEPYNSKWFGFKNLQFLSSPKACRMGKGRMKSEITEDGTVTTYIIRESSLQAQSRDNSGGSNSNLNEEFVALDSKPTTTITYESTSSSAVAAASASRSRELEKLIEETTKDVDEIDEAKPKMQRMPKEIHALPLEHHSYSATVSNNGEMSVNEHHHPMHQQQHQHHHETQHHMEDKQHVETIDIQTAGEEITYQPTTSPGSSGDHHQTIHHQAIPARIIKIQRRDTCTEEEFYDEDEHQHNQHQHQRHVSSSAKHRIYYEPNGPQHTTTILTTPTCTTVPNANSTLLGHTTLKLQRNSSNGSQQMQQQQHQQHQQQQQQQHLQQQQCRDEFSTYGEYVANEMRVISSREILIALKHKINTALFEACMAELQK